MARAEPPRFCLDGGAAQARLMYDPCGAPSRDATDTRPRTASRSLDFDRSDSAARHTLLHATVPSQRFRPVNSAVPHQARTARSTGFSLVCSRHSPIGWCAACLIWHTWWWLVADWTCGPRGPRRRRSMTSATTLACPFLVGALLCVGCGNDSGGEDEEDVGGGGGAAPAGSGASTGAGAAPAGGEAPGTGGTGAQHRHRGLVLADHRVRLRRGRAGRGCAQGE